MSYDSLKSSYAREHINIIEITLDHCDLTFGVAPCTAVGSGDAKCYNTFETCQDRANFTNTTGKTYRFCENRSPHPIGINAKPFLDKVSISPAVISPSGGLGVRSSISASLSDHPSSDIDVDKYVTERTFDPLDKGLFFTKLRARNPGYQFRSFVHESGYLENGVYDAGNFQKRHYVIEKFSASRGQADFMGKDPLKLASSKKSQVPAVSTGQLSANINAAATSITLIPAGVGNLEYPASGFGLLKSEVVSFTRSGDVCTIVRAQKNTVAISHSANDVFQLCYVKNQQVNLIVKDLLENFSGIDPTFIDGAQWQAEADIYLSGLLDGIIVKPMDVNKVLLELAEAAPHYLYWDERTQKIVFVALKAPPASANTINMTANLIEGATSVGEEIGSRLSTIVVNYGQFDPTKRLDEPGNYSGSYIRIDSDSIQKYTSSEIKVINSRWINDTNKAQAVTLATQIGRRFSDIPRSIQFELDPKDSNLWAGDMRTINHRDIVDFSGDPKDTIFQILSVREDQNFHYQALEFKYGELLPGDVVNTDQIIFLSTDQNNINFRTLFDALFAPPSATTILTVIVETGVVIGSATPGTIAATTGTWPAGATITLQVDPSAYVVGAGGRGADGDGTPVAEAGGLALNLEYALTIKNFGIIGGGGGGGGSTLRFGGIASGTGRAAGGGGAGRVAGGPGVSSFTGTELTELTNASAGTLTTGGAGASILWGTSEPDAAAGGKGGDLGVAGTSGGTTGGGAAGVAIDKNGFVLTEATTGDIRGAILA